jgi:hypothetical protein
VTTKPPLLSRLKLRLAGLPRSPRELDLGLRLWAAYRRLGWFAGGAAGPSSGTGEPLPWWTYPAILWLDGHLRGRGAAAGRCLEFGAGASTSWLARRFGRVVSVEHDAAWFGRLDRRRPANVDLRHVPDADPERYLAAVDEEEAWDLVVIDGRHRTACLARALARLPPDGLVLLDNSDRSRYAEAIRSVRRPDVRRIDFFGLSPGVAHLSCTSVFVHRDLDLAVEPPASFGHDLTTYRPL